MQVIGDFTLDALVEIEEPFMDPFDFFPDATAEALEAHHDWLLPRYMDPVSRRLVFCFQSFILRTPRHTILVDSCIGNDKDFPHRPTWHRRQGSFLADLAAKGLTPEDIDFVLCTHLHGDHVGWNTRLVDGRWVPTFANAKYVMARTEADYWHQRFKDDPDGLRSRSFGESVLPVLESGQAVLVDMYHQMEDGVWLEPAPGHTPGNIVVNLKSGKAAATLSGDVIHHPVQLAHPEWSSMACEDPNLSHASRRALIDRLADTDTLLAPAHFATPSRGHIVSKGDAFGYRVQE